MGSPLLAACHPSVLGTKSVLSAILVSTLPLWFVKVWVRCLSIRHLYVLFAVRGSQLSSCHVVLPLLSVVLDQTLDIVEGLFLSTRNLLTCLRLGMVVLLCWSIVVSISILACKTRLTEFSLKVSLWLASFVVWRSLLT